MYNPFTYLRRLPGFISVTEDKGVIEIKGIPADTLRLDISRIWSTSKINGNMFIGIQRNSISFPSFFAVEVLYMLQKMLAVTKTYTRKRPLERIVEELLENTWLKSTVAVESKGELDFSQLNRMRRKGLPHQIQFLENYDKFTKRYNLNGYILAAAPGAGKTMTCLMLGVCLNVDHHVIVSPKNAVFDVWKREILDWVKGSTVWIESEGLPYRGERYLVCHYEALGKMLEVCKGLVGKRTAVTLDESHNLNEISALRTQLFIELCKVLSPVSVVWSSGTPLKALGYEVIPILRTIDTLFTPHSEERFRAIFGRNATRGLDILKHRIGLMSFKVTKEQVRPDKPIELDVKVSVKNSAVYTVDAVKQQMLDYIVRRMDELKPTLKESERFFFECVDFTESTLRTPQQIKAHAQYLDYLKQIRQGFDPFTMSHMSKYCNWYEEKVIQPALTDKVLRDRFKQTRSMIKYLNLKVLGEALGACLGKARVSCHLDMVEEIDFKSIIETSDSKTVIFTSYVAVLERVKVILEQMGYKPVVVYGKTNKDLNLLLETFKHDVTANPILATYKSLSTAVPLVSASTSLFIDQPFRDYIKTQARARTDRLGQQFPIRFFNALLDTGTQPNISTRSNDILAWSKEQVSQIMGDEGSAIEVETVDKYYEGFESFNDGSLHPGFKRGIVTMEKLIEDFIRAM